MRFGALITASVVVGALMMPTAGAGHLPNARCSESGDVCVSARLVDGKRILRIATAAKFFGRYAVCVTTPDGSISCQRGRMRDGNGDGTWTGSMNWQKRFVNGGPGGYTVRWESGNGFRSQRVGFHVR